MGSSCKRFCCLLGLYLSATAHVWHSFGGAAFAATLLVGPDQAYKSIADAAAAARSGDTVSISAGLYADCAVWRADRLTIAGVGTGPVFSGKTCQDKGIFVVLGNDITIRNIKFAGALSSLGNGAGIRAQGTNLTVEGSAFENNQNGILADGNPQSSIVIRDSLFKGNGACVIPQGCAHGIYIGRVAFLHVEGSHFSDTKTGHHIKSRALRTEIVNNRIEDGTAGSSSYLIDVPNGGTVTITGNVLEKGAKTENPSTAIAIGEEGRLVPSDGLLIQNNRFTNDNSATAFVRNKSVTPAKLSGNVFDGHDVVALIGPGTVN